ncbi:MAG TPA: hypothetical protein VJ306_20795 [Pyrinomonadaceae bacterium]|nr:hypothetical protein [Pyrinomonadaceae bacterium]
MSKHHDGSRLLSEAGKVDLFQTAYDELLSWCRSRDFAGHDPFDALNSTLFQATPLAQSRNARFIFTQLVKRFPIDVRQVVRVPAERNAKGIALFALALLANYRRVKTEESRQQANEMLAALLAMQVDGYAGISWGYNFHWQSRNFFALKQMPTIVATAFAARALVEGGLHKEARSVCEFIEKELPRSVDNANEVCFSYAPNSNTRVFNASLLAAEVLASVGKLTGESELLDLAERATRYVVNNQRPDGSWFYGADPKQSWIDNFHTAYILFSLQRIINSSSFGSVFQPALERGYEYWKNNFFLADGWPKYYDHNPYPADAHAAASAIVTFLECRSLDSDALKMARKVASWTIEHLRDRRGFFYYQRRRFHTIRKPFMRWTEAWMLYALARLLEEEQCRSQQT